MDAMTVKEGRSRISTPLDGGVISLLAFLIAVAFMLVALGYALSVLWMVWA